MKVYITRDIPEVAMHMLRDAGHEVVVSTKNDVLTHDELVSELAKHNPDAVLCLLNDTIDRTVFDAARNAKVFANYAVGYNNISLDIARARAIASSAIDPIVTCGMVATTTCGPLAW